MAALSCFWLEATDTQQVILRRFRFQQGECQQGRGYHDTQTIVGTEPIRWITIDGAPYAGQGERFRAEPALQEPSHEDPRWPQVCDACGYRFVEDDEWQVRAEQLYRRVDTGELLPADDFGPGALYDAWWLPATYRGADGIALMCRTPGGLWTVDGPATGGGKWERTGNPREPKTLTVRPSIQTGHAGAPGSYHGFLTNGVLSDA